jgi:transcriptional regulator with XRE-family HTH domain
MEFETNNLTLKKLRIIKDVEQTELAKILKIAPSTYSKKELGQRKFDIEEFKKLSDFFKLSMEEMYIILENTKK